MASTAKIILAVGGIFLAGAITGGFVGVRLADRFGPEKRGSSRNGINEMIGGRLAEQLDLTPDQKQSIRPIINRAADELRKVRADAFSRTSALIAEMDAELAKHLTPAQCEQLKQIRAKQEERRKQWLLERSKRTEPSGFGPAGGEGPPAGPPPAPPAHP